jgi:hypothetical protein
MKNQGPKHVSAIKTDREILGYACGFNCYGGSSSTRERDIKNAIDKCHIDPNSIFLESVLAGLPGSDENYLSVRGRREDDLKEVRAMLLTGDFGYSEG